MTIDERLEPEGAPERSPKAGRRRPFGRRREWFRERFSVFQRKMAIVASIVARVSLLDLGGPANECLRRQGDPSGAISCLFLGGYGL